MRTLTGTIISDAMHKTRVVAVVRHAKHPRYHKYRAVTNTFKAHDEKNEYRKGDVVIIQETRPMSKDKRWRIVGKVENANLKMSAKGGSASGGKNDSAE